MPAAKASAADQPATGASRPVTVLSRQGLPETHRQPARRTGHRHGASAGSLSRRSSAPPLPGHRPGGQGPPRNLPIQAGGLSTLSKADRNGRKGLAGGQRGATSHLVATRHYFFPPLFPTPAFAQECAAGQARHRRYRRHWTWSAGDDIYGQASCGFCPSRTGGKGPATAVRPPRIEDGVPMPAADPITSAHDLFFRRGELEPARLTGIVAEADRKSVV